MNKIVSTMPYESIILIKIFQAIDDNYYIDIILEGEIVHTYRVKSENVNNKAFDKEEICSHWETDFDYTVGGAETDEEKRHIDEFLMWSEFAGMSTYGWHTGTIQLDINEEFKPIIQA